MWDLLLNNLEWSDWVVMCFLFIPSLLGAIFGVSLMWLHTAKNTSQQSADEQESSMSVYRCIPVSLQYWPVTTMISSKDQ